MDSQSGPLLFSHVPKTAGTSLRALATRLTPDTAFVYSGEFALGNPNIDFIKEFREKPSPPLIMGHFSYGVHRFIGTPPRYALVMRDPVMRIISLYRMIYRDAPNSPYAKFFRENGTLKDFVAGGFTEQTNNHVTRMCAGIPPDAGLLIKDRWLFECALHNLRRHYVLIGLIERLELFVAAMGKLLGWPETQVPMENVGTGEQVILDTETRSLIEDHNALDFELYELVKSGALHAPN
jgi:hypothetical protein